MSGSSRHVDVALSRQRPLVPAVLRSARRLVKDGVGKVRRFFGLPHDRSRSEVWRLKAGFDESVLDRQRARTIAHASGCPPSLVREFIADLDRGVWDEICRSRPWQTRDRSMMSDRDSTTLYALARALNPEICVETGVARGGSSTYLLEVLERNGAGRLHSIDIQSPRTKLFGQLIPDHLRHRWDLRVQQDKPLLGELLCELGTIDFFLHDSRHTHQHMKWEYELAWRHLRPGGCLASHDIVCSTAFADFRREHADEIEFGDAVGNFGFLIKRASR